jgi:hypothetical protein
VQLEISDQLSPDIKGREDRNLRTDEQLSSGEKELITLAVEILYFVYQVENAERETKRDWFFSLKT